jgi:hypothetical protein
MNHPLTTLTLAKIRQAELLEEAETNRLLRETQAARPLVARQWLAFVLLMAAGMGVLFVLAA